MFRAREERDWVKVISENDADGDTGASHNWPFPPAATKFVLNGSIVACNISFSSVFLGSGERILQLLLDMTTNSIRL